MMSQFLSSLCLIVLHHYIDDVIIFSKSWSQHLSDVHSVLSWIKSAGLTIKHTKCVRGAPSVEFFGMVVSANGINIPHARTKALSAYKRPVTRKQLRLFLGLVSFYRAFLPSLATHNQLQLLNLHQTMSHGHLL